MNEIVTLLARIEFPSEAMSTWLTEQLPVATYRPEAQLDWGWYIRFAYQEGVLKRPLPETVADLLDYIRDPDLGWEVDQRRDCLEIRVDAVTSADADPYCIRAAIAVALFAHAVETAGASAYLYLLDVAHLDEPMPHRERWWGVDGVLRCRTSEDEEASKPDLVDETRQRLSQTPKLWTVAEDLEAHT